MFKMRFDTENAAFDDGNRDHEVARILRNIADKIESGQATGLNQNVFDENGNIVGTFVLSSDSD